jgi:CHAT domain-containing protein
LHRFDTRVSAAVLEESSSRFLDAVRSGDDVRAQREGRSLYEKLISPATSALAGAVRLVIVADAPLDRVPFAALVQPDGTVLIERFVLDFAPAIRSHVPARARTAAPVSALSVGNPRLDRARYPSLPALDEAQAEAREIAAMYPKSVLLLGAEATEAHVVPLLSRAAVIHFATHAIADPSNTDNSRLLLASDGTSDGALTAAEVANMDLRAADTVVLAACRTAAASGHAYGFVQSIATAFLAAGAQHVVGSLWDIDDRASRMFSVALHRGLRNGLAPDQAIREAQLQMMRSYSMENWSALQLYARN